MQSPFLTKDGLITSSSNMKFFMICAASVLAVLPIHALSVAPLPKPAISLERALELAKEYARDKKIDLSHHYLDRVLIGYQEGQSDRRWIISWTPDPDGPKSAAGIILKVKLDGTVTDEAGEVRWQYSQAPEASKVEPPPVNKPSPTK